MPLYKIADILVEMSPKYEETAKWYEPYLSSSDEQPQIEITVNDQELDYYVENGKDITPPISENMIFCNKFNGQLIKFGGSYIHSSALKFEDKVYLFSGDSGIGKSTHTRKWCRLFPKQARVINDDKPSFRMIDGKCIIYGTPFAGGTDIQLNESGELGGIIFIERSEENRLESISNKDAIVGLMQQTPKKISGAAQGALLSMYSEIIEKYPFYKLYCADNDDAVKAAFNIIK